MTAKVLHPTPHSIRHNVTAGRHVRCDKEEGQRAVIPADTTGTLAIKFRDARPTAHFTGEEL
jgi:hypothetical protein